MCTLRAAITEANLHAGPDTIAFSIPGGGVQTITIGSALPTINDTTGGVTIDGYTQPGASVNTDPLIDNAVIRIQITSTDPNRDGIFVSSSNNVIRGLSMYNLHRSIVIQTSGAKGNSVVGSFIGTNAAGTFVAPNWISGGNGVIVTQAASYTTVGGTNPADRDVLSGNEANGFSTYNEQTDHNVVQGDLIGLAPNGQPIRACSGVCYGQLSHGVDINTGSSYNIIGGTGPGQRNVISNNRGEGIEFSHSSTTDSNQAIGNYIGTDVTGNAGAANKFGNGLNGIHLEDGTSNDVIAYNVIGSSALRADGSEVMGGIGIEGFYTSGIWVHDNKIGVGVDGLTPFPNGFFGIDVHFNASWVTIGPNNIIANNPTGVVISDTTDLDNTVTGNSIYNNGSAGTGLGIQLLNHANNSIGTPTIAPSGVSLTAASGTACAGCTVEVFAASPNPGDAGGGGAGQGKVFLGTATVPASGTFTVGFSQTLNPGDLVTATVTDPAGDTSQFSTNVAAAAVSAPTPPPTPLPTPTPTITTYAADTFGRTVSQGWGRADIGGNYAGFYCTNDDMNVTGGAATVVVADPHNPEICPKDSTVDTNYRGGYLTNLSAQDVDIRFRVKTSTLSTSDNQNVGFDVRRVSGFTSYRGQVRLTTSNQVWLQAGSVMNNTMTTIGANTRAPGASVSTSAFIWVRAQVTGTNPTTIKMKAWNDGSAEPSTWAYTATDSTPVLQAPGAAGLVTWLSGNWNQGPVTETFDDFNVTSPISGTIPAAPVANFSSAQAGGTLNVNFTDTSTGGPPTSWWWDFGDGSGSTSQSPVHAYAAPGSYQVTLIATNNGGFTSKTSTVVVNPLPGPPTANFSYVQQNGTYAVQFTDLSTNSPSSWSWNFGDGSPLSTVQNPLHTYSAAGPYSVSLTATNGSGPGSITKPVTVTSPPVPVAGYSFTQTPGTLTLNFTDTSTNSPTSWAWDFGDGHTSTAQNPSYTFAAGGTYTVTLTASNIGGPSSPYSQSIPVAATAYASDGYARSAASGTWGTAPVGGAWTYVGTQADFSLTGSAGAVNLGTAGATRAAYLPVSAQDVDLTFSFKVDKLPTGGGSVYAYGSVRRSTTSDYRIKARIFGTGAVYLSISRFSGGTETTLGSELQVSGLTYLAGSYLNVHAQVSGLTPTTLKASVWPAGQAEPATFQVSKSDSTAALQGSGQVGLRAYTSSTTSNNPIVESFDSFVAAPIAPLAAPVASFTSTQTAGTYTVQFTDTSTNSPTSWSWTFGDGGTSSLQNPSHAYSGAGPETVTLAATNASGTSPIDSQPITVTAPPVPVSSFTFTQAPGTLTLNFTDTSTNSPTSWAWDFGDGSGTSTLQNPSYTFAAGGTYTVTLTASNIGGPSLNQASHTITVSATPYASDTFTRSAASGTWGSAPTGGVYTYVGSQADFSLTGAAGTINLGTAGATRAAYLAGVSAQDVDLTYQFSINKLPTGGGSVYAYGSVRRSASGTADYRIKARIFGTGAVYLSVSRFSGGTETTIGTEQLVSGLTYTVGTYLNVHAQVSGVSPTTIMANLWPAGQAEPAGWLVTRQDSTSGLQGAGQVGIRAYSSGTTTNNPIVESFDNFVAAPVSSAMIQLVPTWAVVDEDRAA